MTHACSRRSIALVRGRTERGSYSQLGALPLNSAEMDTIPPSFLPSFLPLGGRNVTNRINEKNATEYRQ